MKHLLFLFFCFTLLNLSGQEGVLKLDLRKLAVRPQKFVTVEKQSGGLVAKFPSRTSGNTTPGFSFDLPEDYSPYSVFIVKAALADGSAKAVSIRLDDKENKRTFQGFKVMGKEPVEYRIPLKKVNKGKMKSGIIYLSNPADESAFMISEIKLSK